MGGWTDTDSFMNGKNFILGIINDTQNHGSDSMHIRNRNIYSEGFVMCHTTVILIKTNTLNLRNPIFTLAQKTIHASEKSPPLIIGAILGRRCFVL